MQKPEPKLQPKLNTQSKTDRWLTRSGTGAAILGAVVGVIGTIVTGWWTYSRFIAEDLPALALRPKMDGDLRWYERTGSNKECIAEFKIKLENIGKSTMTLTEATVGAWPLNSKPLEGTPVVYVDPIKEIEGVKPFGGEPKNILGNYLRKYYPPGVADELGTLFIVKRDPGKMILFLAKGKYQVEGKEPEDWFWHQWDEVCRLKSSSQDTR
jgi:hypothetical protein